MPIPCSFRTKGASFPRAIHLIWTGWPTFQTFFLSLTKLRAAAFARNRLFAESAILVFALGAKGGAPGSGIHGKIDFTAFRDAEFSSAMQSA
jgi:hypothetical protein